MQNALELRKNQLKPVLMTAQKQITSLLQDKSKANKFMAASLVVASNSALNKCTPESIVQALVGVAMSNLSIDSNLAQCYLVPYKDKAQLQIGYKGFIQLLFRAGWMVKSVPVFMCDEFSMEFDGWDNKIKLIQNIDDRDEGNNEWVFNNLRGVYAVARHTDTHDEYSSFVSKATIEKLRKTSPNQRVGKYTKPAEKDRLKNGLPVGIWESWYLEMAQAKAIKKLAKILPIGDTRESTVIAMDDLRESGATINYAESEKEGVIIEMLSGDDDDQLITKFIQSINKSKSIDDLNKLKNKVETFSGADVTKIRTAWSEKLKEFKPVEKIDSKVLIAKCKSTDELSAALQSIPEMEQMELTDMIDEKYDSFR